MVLLIFLVWSEEVPGGSFPNLTIFRTPRPKLYAGGDFRSLKIENYLPKYNHERNDHRTHSQVRFQSPCFDDSAKCLHNSSDTRTRLNQHTVGRCTNGAAVGSATPRRHVQPWTFRRGPAGLGSAEKAGRVRCPKTHAFWTLVRTHVRNRGGP